MDLATIIQTDIAARAADLQAKVDQAKRTHSDQSNQPAE